MKIESSLSLSQKQLVIKCSEKKTRKNGRPISLLMVIQTYYLESKHKPILPSIISSNKTGYVEKRYISESGRLISDIIETCGKENILGYLVVMDLEKAFDFLDHDFLLSVLENFGFGDNFINWSSIVLNDQQFCVIIRGFATQYITLKGCSLR